MKEPHRRETAVASRMPLGHESLLALACADAGCALAGHEAGAPVAVLAIPLAEHREGRARVSRIALANSGPKWHSPERGVLELELPQGEGSRQSLHPGTHQVHM